MTEEKAKEKYPYIADKNMYAAVMCACKYIRKTGYFNKAVKHAAKWYGVSEYKLAEEIRKRQAAGQKIKAKKREPVKMHNFIVTCYCWCDAHGFNGDEDIIWIKTVKGKSKETVEKRFDEWAWNMTKQCDTGSAYSQVYEIDVKEAIEGGNENVSK